MHACIHIDRFMLKGRVSVSDHMFLLVEHISADGSQKQKCKYFVQHIDRGVYNLKHTMVNLSQIH